MYNGGAARKGWRRRFFCSQPNRRCIMTLNEIRIVLGWCSVINVGLMIFSFLVLAGARA
jgi:hypothetical protein